MSICGYFDDPVYGLFNSAIFDCTTVTNIPDSITVTQSKRNVASQSTSKRNVVTQSTSERNTQTQTDSKQNVTSVSTSKRNTTSSSTSQ